MGWNNPAFFLECTVGGCLLVQIRRVRPTNMISLQNLLNFLSLNAKSVAVEYTCVRGTTLLYVGSFWFIVLS